MEPIDLNAPLTRTASAEGKIWNYFGGTAYLGLQTLPEFQERYIENVLRFGTAYGASREANVRFPVYNEVESLLADWLGHEEALTLSSGYLASQLVCQTLAAKGHTTYQVKGAHASLSNGFTEKLSLDFETLREKLNKEETDALPPVVMLDSIDFRGLHYPSFSELAKLPLDRLILVVDDSHGFGVIGEDGIGSSHALRKLEPTELIVCGSLNKGLATQAGVVLASSKRISDLKKNPIYSSASPASPASLQTLLETVALRRTQFEKLQENLAVFERGTVGISWLHRNQGHPAYTCDCEGISRYLEELDTLITSFEYPAHSGHTINRIILSADHQANDIERLCRLLNEFVSR
ncbi:pyridoxal phosphate-dependent aminotransferase family protein [Pelagicoccus albus]|uniref:Pyridoxal phosphate-dependent aminotransferase family protein n=1 Tax=Pelagicoccus albus TaxID=415222 RepID=A0A7X1E8E2_9BACT|nr:pyridoxal phosphate-dependent aminotransferase family protein [Pelagicoccus albus]MBC2606710.1 pyridoxal phosphate-dependent aminotransferase family protein [Pelagicoccus albus]